MNKNWMIDRGWHTWYNENYWVHPETVENPKTQDYTNYGITLEDAVRWEMDGRPKRKDLRQAIDMLIDQLVEIYSKDK